ncbi:hypothetical protein H6G96_14190 [Nostoc sp. FACHB-892]|uniref:hypothetical protein n=1 Tax=Nostoc sp. FACHB-892 TaxID=2692843 RepID=UPI001684110E|nr:hypothetical protein [Nostoc sp. FACHB-892]MBD2727447.1 hypothetical protein [Nostoc sp. FACHB-892]
MFLASSAQPSYESTDAKNLNLINRNLASILPEGQLEVRSPGVVTRTDPKLELVFTIQNLQTLFGVGAKFNINEYTIVLDVPGLAQSRAKWQKQKLRFNYKVKRSQAQG